MKPGQQEKTVSEQVPGGLGLIAREAQFLVGRKCITLCASM